jgi:glycosyltransferase involved in cell wall biosynthesis
MTTVSVIVPCHNAADFLAATIESVLQQELPDWELILVDDGSRDSTWEIMSRYIGSDSRIAGFRKDNEGTSRTRNYGFARSTPAARYLIFLDHDDQLEPDALRKLCVYMDAHPEVGLLGCQYRDIGADGSRLGTGKRSRWVPGILFPRELRDDEADTPFVAFFCATGQGPFAMYRRSVYQQTDGWEAGFWPHEDTDMFCQMALLAKVHYLPQALYLKRTHPAQGMSDGFRVQQSYGSFRAKWDNRLARNGHEATVLRKAKKYYYTMHRPCRDLKVARQATREFFARPSLARIKWCMQLLQSALHGLVVRRFDIPR